MDRWSDCRDAGAGDVWAEQLHQRHERAQQTALANQQFAMAMQVTDHALAQTREQLQRAGLNLSE